MAQADTVATLASGDVGLATSLTLMNFHPHRVAKDNPRGGTETLKLELGRPLLRVASSTGSRLTKPDKLWTKVSHAEHEPTAEYLRWELVAQAVKVFWLSVALKLRDRLEAWRRARTQHFYCTGTPENPENIHWGTKSFWTIFSFYPIFPPFFCSRVLGL
eukprot:977221-Amphidinium_carterae.1